MPDSLRLNPNEQAKLTEIQENAKIRHEAARKAAKKLGRKDFPLLPFECSWAYQEQFRREIRSCVNRGKN